MKKKLPVVIGIVITIFAAYFYANTKKTHKIYNNDVNTAVYEAINVLQDSETISQKFICKENQLDGFMIKAGVTGDYEDAVVSVEVKDAKTGEVLTRGEESGENIRPRKLHYFKVTPLQECKNRELILEITEQHTSADQGILFYWQPQKNTEDAVSIKGEEKAGVFVMKTVTERFDIETFCVMLFLEWFIWGFLWFLYRMFK